VNAVLRMHSIKPHWMFALDNLVRTAVQAAILVLSPELGAHLADQGVPAVEPPVGPPRDAEHGAHPHPVQIDSHRPSFDQEGGSTSGVSTVNSGFQVCGQSGMMTTLGKLRDENRILLGDLCQAQHSYQELLKQSLAEQKLHLQLLSQSLAASSLSTKDHQGHIRDKTAQLSRQISTDEDSHSSEVACHIHRKMEPEVDEVLVRWLTNLGMTQETIAKITSEEITLPDLQEYMSRDDLRRLGLKAGPELRIWRAILQHRDNKS